MARFRSLSEVIRFQVMQISPPLEVSSASPLAVQIGQFVPNQDAQLQNQDVFIWGFATWGVDTITTDYSPKDQP